jgi:rhamnogalacturonan acetylesterase
MMWLIDFRISLLPLLLLILTHSSRADSVATQPNDAKPTLWLIGDSTVKNGQDKGGLSQWGWGHPLPAFFDTTHITIQNRAHGGTSSRTYQTNGDWDRVLSQIKPGDYLLMQFGTNDGGSLNDTSRARASMPGNGEETTEIDNQLTHKPETVHTYGWYIRKFISDAKSKGAAAAIVCSPIPRNIWSNGEIVPNTKYALWASQAAKEANAPFIDLNTIIDEKYQTLGQQYVTENLFPPKGEHTHTNWTGAILNAQSVVEGIRSLKDCDLSQYLLATPPTDFPDPTPAPPAASLTSSRASATP